MPMPVTKQLEIFYLNWLNCLCVMPVQWTTEKCCCGHIKGCFRSRNRLLHFKCSGLLCYRVCVLLFWRGNPAELNTSQKFWSHRLFFKPELLHFSSCVQALLSSSSVVIAFLHRESQMCMKKSSVWMTYLSPSSISLNQRINNRLLLFFWSGGKDGGSYEPHRYPPIFVSSSVAFFFFNTCMGRIASFPLIHPSVECWHLIFGCMLGKANKSYLMIFFFSLKQLYLLSLACKPSISIF